MSEWVRLTWGGRSTISQRHTFPAPLPYLGAQMPLHGRVGLVGMVIALELLELRNKDVTVLEFTYDDTRHRVDRIARLVNPEWCPPSLVGTDGTIGDVDLDWWWSHRSIPASREQVERLARTLDLDGFSELLEHNFALSLSDRYWVSPHGSALAWADVNFFDNPFSDRLGVLTLDPSSSPASARLTEDDLMSPNSTVGGNVPKRWTIDADGTRVLVKAGTRLFDQDVYNEAVATALYDRVLDEGEYVRYVVAHGGSGAVSCCRNFLREDEELVTCADVLRRHRHDRGYGTYPNCLAALAEESGLGEDYLSSKMSRLFCLDALMANSDRHTGNFGLIRDCVTLEYKGFAPFYDCGCSLWCDRRELDAPTDYDYSPRPFVGRPSESPWNQVRLFSDYSWMPRAHVLDDWESDAERILASNPLMPEPRLDAVITGISSNIQKLEAHVDRMLGLEGRPVRRRLG